MVSELEKGIRDLATLFMPEDSIKEVIIMNNTNDYIDASVEGERLWIRLYHNTVKSSGYSFIAIGKQDDKSRECVTNINMLNQADTRLGEKWNALLNVLKLT